MQFPGEEEKTLADGAGRDGDIYIYSIGKGGDDKTFACTTTRIYPSLPKNVLLTPDDRSFWSSRKVHSLGEILQMDSWI